MKDFKLNTVDRVAVCSRSFSQDPILRAEVLQRYQHVSFNETGKTLIGEDLYRFLSNHSKAIVGLERIDEQLIRRLPDLKVIGKYGVGMDAIDFNALQSADIRFGWTGGVNRRSVAELVIAFSIAMLRSAFSSGVALRESKWEPTKGRELGASRLGLIGCGFVGQEVARLARAFGTEIWAYDIRDLGFEYQSIGIRSASMQEILCESDIVSLHVPLTAKTRGMIGPTELAQMKRTSILINTSRGGIVDEDALESAILKGEIAGAAFDVFRDEPPRQRPLLMAPNFWGTPHIGGSSREAILAMGRAAIAGLDHHQAADRFLSLSGVP